MQQKAARHPDDIPMPPVWWHSVGEQISVFRYLPDTMIDGLRAPPEDVVELVKFICTVRRVWSETLTVSSVDSLTFGPFVENPLSMQRFSDAGHPWFKQAIAVQNLEIPLPDWISDREKEIRLAALNGQQMPTGLARIVT
jgi:hypothetical protein